MNLWRMLGISAFLLGMVCFVSTANYAGGQDKDKKADPVKDQKVDPDKDKKKPDADKDKKADPDKDKKADPDKDKKKPDPEKEKKPEPPKAGSETWSFKAFDKGSVFYQTQTTETTQKMKVMGQEVTQNQTQTFVIKWTAGDMDGKNFKVKQEIKGVDMSIDIGGNKITYDSTNTKNPKNPMTDFFDKLQAQKLTFTITPELTVKSIDGRKEFIKALSDINPQMKSLLDNILSEDALIRMSEPTWGAFPKGGSVSVGQTWKQDTKLDLGPVGTYATTFDYTYKGKNEIDIKAKLDYSAPTKKEGLPFIIHTATLTSDDGKGTAIFDPAKGRFSKTELTMTLKGKLKIEVGNMTTEVDLNQTQKATTLTSDNDPWADKKSKSQ